MIFFPAIDLKDGQCVRLLRGEMDKATVFNHEPASQAIIFEKNNSKWLHLVDLNGAFEGRPVNGAAIEGVLAAVNIPVQLGGGIREMATIDMWLNRGIRRVILGTSALRDPALVREACKRHAGRVAVGIDVRNGFVAVDGWAKTAEVKASELARRLEGVGVAAIIYTDISRDGAMEGPNLKATVELAAQITIPVILSGGISSIDDIKRIAKSGANLAGVISGRAVYDGRVDVAQAVCILEEVAGC